MGKSFNTGNLTNIIGYSGSNVAITGSVNISGTVVSTGTSLVSGSGQISYTGITNIPSGIVSGSAQTIANLPSGVVSGSAQVTTFGFGTTGSNTFQGSQTINGSLVVTGSLTAQQFIVSSSVTYLTESFASGSHKFGDTSDDTHQFTGSVYISGSIGTTGNVGVGVLPNYGALDVRSSSTSISTLDGVGGFFKNTPKGGGLSIRVHDTQVDLASTWFYGSTNMDLTLTTVATDAVYRERMRIQASDGAMAFNTSIVGVRSYLFKALPSRQLAIEALESGGVHSIYLRPSSSGRNLIASNYFSGGVYLPLALSGRENDSDLVLHANGNISVNNSSDIGTKFQINGANYVEMATFACTSAGAATIVTDNSGYVQFSYDNVRHCSNTDLFVPVTNGMRITKSGILHITFSQDITTTTAVGYVAGYIRKNTVNISENLITNTNAQWDGINGVTTINVAANDVINFFFSASDITSFDPGSWSNYSFIWTSR